MTDFSQAIEELSERVSLGGFAALSAVILAVLVLVVVFIRRDQKKNRRYLQNELRGYYNGIYEMNKEKYIPSGKVTLTGDEMRYQRGNDSIVVDLYIDKDETILFPSLLDSWFETRNYSERQIQVIFRDIEHFLMENKLTKNVIIMTDEEAEEYFGISDEDD